MAGEYLGGLGDEGIGQYGIGETEDTTFSYPPSDPPEGTRSLAAANQRPTLRMGWRPRPKVARREIEDGVEPFKLEWENPRRRVLPRQDFVRGYMEPAAPPPEQAPFLNEWENPLVRVPRRQDFFRGATPEEQAPFINEWENPRRRIPLRPDFIAGSNPPEDQPPGKEEIGQPQFRPRLVRDYMQRAFLENEPLRPEDWPNPRPRPYPTDLRGFIQEAWAAQNADEPIRPPFWQNPVVKRYPLQPSHLRLYDEDIPVRPHEWPVPKGRPYPTILRWFTYYGTQYQPIPQIPPPNMSDWPNPRGRPFPTILRGFINTSIYIIPPVMGFNQYEWPVPKGRPFPRSLRGWDFTGTRFIGQDTIYGAPGQGVPLYDWPVPKGRPQSIKRQSQVTGLPFPSFYPLTLPPPILGAIPVTAFPKYEEIVGLPDYSAEVALPLYSEDSEYPAYIAEVRYENSDQSVEL